MKKEETELKIEYKDQFSVAEYYALVNEIVDGFFGDDGEFTPHIGDMVAMLAFFNDCVINKKDIIDAEKVEDVLDADELFLNEDFILAFNEAIYFDGDIKYDFANAYKNAMEIVTYRNTSVPRAFNNLLAGLNKIVESVTSVMSEENVEKITNLAEAVSNKDFSAKAIGDAFAETEAFKKIMEETPTEKEK